MKRKRASITAAPCRGATLHFLFQARLGRPRPTTEPRPFFATAVPPGVKAAKKDAARRLPVHGTPAKTAITEPHRTCLSIGFGCPVLYQITLFAHGSGITPVYVAPRSRTDVEGRKITGLNSGWASCGHVSLPGQSMAAACCPLAPHNGDRIRVARPARQANHW